jgi:methyl-accepting chemotaxis protein
VLPKISEYRIDQAEKHANAYEGAVQKFWASGNLPAVRQAIEDHARESGADVPDVMAKMVPGGELEDLRVQFVEAIGDSPDAQESKKGMDRALDSWLKQYSRGVEEFQNPETDQNPEYDALRERFETTRTKMGDLVGQSPVFAGEDKSHAERFREAMDRIAKKIKEILERVTEFVRGRNATPEPEASPNPGDSNEP